MDFERYVELFNAGDDDAFCEQMFTEDVVMETATRLIEGRPALRAFLEWAHDGVRELPRPQRVAYAGDHVFVEIDMDFFATRDRPDFVFQPMKRGETITCKFFVVYTVRGDRVCRLKTCNWPPNLRVTAPPDYSALLG